MKRLKVRLILAALIILIALGFILYKNYPLMEAAYYNRTISVSEVKFLMTEAELKQTLGDGEFVNGMGGNGWRFADEKVMVMISAVGLFRDKVVSIETENPEHWIMGIKVGDSLQLAKDILHGQGFKEEGSLLFSNGDIQIQLFGGTEISGLKIMVQDPAYRDAVF